MKNIGIIDPVYWEILNYASRNNLNIHQILQSISSDQLNCKSWLIEELSILPYNYKNVQLYGGWYGWPLIDLLLKSLDTEYILNIDKDKEAINICYQFKKLKGFDKNTIQCKNEDVSVPRERAKWKQHDGTFDLVINTSSEHMADLPILINNKTYNPNCVFALQSNNMFHLEEHINCVNSKKELEEKSGLNKILYSGKKVLSNGYERYMVIGLG